MIIQPIQNATLKINGHATLTTAPTSFDGKIVVSSFKAEFESKIKSYEIDHCECIASSVIIDGNLLLITLVTQRNEIDEFITITVQYVNGKHRTYKIRFIR